MLRPFRKPLVIMTPKSLLRHPMAKSSADEFVAASHFKRILSDRTEIADGKVRRLVLCSGKVAYDLMASATKRGLEDVSIVRLEQLYPFPGEPLAARLQRMTALQEVVWCQEEPRNNGAWFFVESHIEDALTEAGPRRDAPALRRARRRRARPPPASPSATKRSRRRWSPTRSGSKSPAAHRRSPPSRNPPEETRMSQEVKVPTLGESVTEATIGEWLKQPGDPVKVDEPIASLETDKVAVEVPAPVAGVMGEHAVEVGATVEVGAVIATIEDDVGAGRSDLGRAARGSRAEGARARRGAGAGPRDRRRKPRPTPRRRCRPRCAARCSSTGSTRRASRAAASDGRLTKEDVLAAAQAKTKRPAPRSVADLRPRPLVLSLSQRASGERREERVKMTRMRQTIAKRLKSAQEHRRAADHLQRRRHDRGHRGAREVQGHCSPRSTASSSAS